MLYGKHTLSVEISRNFDDNGCVTIDDKNQWYEVHAKNGANLQKPTFSKLLFKTLYYSYLRCTLFLANHCQNRSRHTDEIVGFSDVDEYQRCMPWNVSKGDKF